MNPHKYFVSAELMNNPLCGIGTQKDILDLATGQVTRVIKKLVLTGEKEYTYESSNSRFITSFPNVKIEGLRLTQVYCTHFISVYDGRPISDVPNNSIYSSDAGVNKFFIKTTDYTSSSDFKAYLAQQYTAGTPVIVWYVLETPETEQITVPSGLSGTVEGYLIQVGTPTPETPIYPTANTAKGWYDINAYKRSVLVWNTDTAYERSDGSWT